LLPKADKERGKHQLFETVHYHHLINKKPATSFLIDFREKICFFAKSATLCGECELQKYLEGTYNCINDFAFSPAISFMP